MSLADLGADSMALARLAAAIKDRFGVTIPLPQLVKMPSLLHLQLAIFGGGTISNSVLLSQVAATSSESSLAYVTDWSNELETIWDPLETSLREIVSTHQDSTNTKRQDKGSILLTGATGFFGAFLLRELLTNADYLQYENITCIVRGKTKEEAKKRVKDNLEFYGFWEDGFQERIVAINGELSSLRLGLDTEEDYENLAQAIELIFHNAAVVNSVLPYPLLRAPNVVATANILEFAAKSSAVLHHVSTIGLLAGSGVQDESEEVPSTALPSLSGYAQSKWVAEQLVIRAVRKLLLPCFIYRPGTLAGHSETGACNPYDTVVRLVVGLAQEGIYCTEATSPLPRTFPLIPTDWAAWALVTIAKHSRPQVDPLIYNIVNRKPLSLEDLIDGIQAMREPTARLQPISADDFRDRMAKLPADHPLYVFQSVLSGSGFATGSAFAPADDNTRSALERVTAGKAPKSQPKNKRRSVKMGATSCPTFTCEMVGSMLAFCGVHK